MKRKVTLMGLAMITGLPPVACAKSVNKDASPTYSSWNTSYMPHYSAEGAAKPLMDHVSGMAYPGRT